MCNFGILNDPIKASLVGLDNDNLKYDHFIYISEVCTYTLVMPAHTLVKLIRTIEMSHYAELEYIILNSETLLRF